MSYYYCRRSDPSWTIRGHGYCNGYEGEFDTYVCRCPCHDAERGIVSSTTTGQEQTQ
jgi:hypothetical protein